jgi:hypothetical protein
MVILDVLGEGGNRGRDQVIGYEVGRSGYVAKRGTGIEANSSDISSRG